MNANDFEVFTKAIVLSFGESGITLIKRKQTKCKIKKQQENF